MWALTRRSPPGSGPHTTRIVLGTSLLKEVSSFRTYLRGVTAGYYRFGWMT
jgi:hypothetical protein